MRFRPTKRGFHTVAGTSVALAMVLCAELPTAAAGCLNPHVAPRPGTAHLDQLAAAGALSVAGSEPAPAPAPPCAGFRCAGDPSSQAPSTLIETTRVEHWGCLSPQVPITSSRFNSRPADEPAARPSHQGPSLYRPPRERPAFQRP